MRFPTTFLDPVSAYDRAAPFFADISARRSKYLESIESLIVSRIPSGSQSLLDIGAGDGKRAMRIANRASLARLVLLEPSAEMRKQIRGNAETVPIRAEELNDDSFPARDADGRSPTANW